MFSSFMIDTWIAGTMVAIAAGCVGFFVVARSASFSAHALPLGAFPGAALADLLGVNQLYGLVTFSALGVVGITQLGGGARRDTATALILVMLLGFGALFLSLSGTYAPAAYTLLFGQALGISRATLIPLGLICALCVAALASSFRPLLLNAAAPALTEALGISSRRLDLWFLGILALVTATALPIVGALLVFSLTIAPAAAARYLTNRPLAAMLLSAMTAVAEIWTAIALSYLSNWPIGFYVGVLGILVYAAGRASASFGTFAASRR